MGRTAKGVASEVLEALGPVGDALALGTWAMDIGHTFENESSTGYDKFVSIIGLVDILGIFRTPQEEIDLAIMASRWDKVTSREHYTYTVHQDLVTEQDVKDKQHWADFSGGYHNFLTITTSNLVDDVALKYHAYYLDAVKSQARLAQELMNGIDQETYKSLNTHLAATKNNTRIFFNDLEEACETQKLI